MRYGEISVVFSPVLSPRLFLSSGVTLVREDGSTEKVQFVDFTSCVVRVLAPSRASTFPFACFAIRCSSTAEFAKGVRACWYFKRGSGGSTGERLDIVCVPVRAQAQPTAVGFA